MSLARIWIPTPNYSASRKQNRLLVLHTAQGAKTYRELGNYFSNPAVQGSSQVGIDDTPGQIGEYMHPDNKAWAAFAANDWGEHAELCGFAEWTRDQWLQHMGMLNNTIQWILEECTRNGIPIRQIDANMIRNGESGVCGHADVVAAGAGGNHWDPGPNFPWDYIFAHLPMSPTPPIPAPPQPQPSPVPSGPTGGHPAWPGRLLIVKNPLMSGADVLTFQRRMQERGWNLGRYGVDGVYGNDTANVVEKFQREKGLEVDRIVGRYTWNAAWEMPIT